MDQTNEANGMLFIPIPDTKTKSRQILKKLSKTAGFPI